MALEVGLRNRVLNNKPGGLRAVVTHERSARPAVLVKDRRQSIGIACVHGSHARMITIEQFAGLNELTANAVVLDGKREQPISQ